MGNSYLNNEYTSDRLMNGYMRDEYMSHENMSDGYMRHEYIAWVMKI